MTNVITSAATTPLKIETKITDFYLCDFPAYRVPARGRAHRLQRNPGQGVAGPLLAPACGSQRKGLAPCRHPAPRQALLAFWCIFFQFFLCIFSTYVPSDQI